MKQQAIARDEVHAGTFLGSRVLMVRSEAELRFCIMIASMRKWMKGMVKQTAKPLQCFMVEAISMLHSGKQDLK